MYIDIIINYNLEEGLVLILKIQTKKCQHRIELQLLACRGIRFFTESTFPRFNCSRCYITVSCLSDPQKNYPQNSMFFPLRNQFIKKCKIPMLIIENLCKNIGVELMSFN